jgi:Phage Terminase
VSDELDRFAEFAGKVLRLDSGGPFELAGFQRWLLAPFFAGARECVLSTPKGQGKSTMLGALAVFELLTIPESEIIVCAASRDQASVLLGQAQGFVRRHPSLARRLRLTRREVEHPSLAGRMRVISADASTGDGLIPSLVLCDELHRWRSADLFETLVTALSKRSGRMLTISTAGLKDDSCPLWPVRERALALGARRDGARLAADSSDGSFALRELSAPTDADWRDLDVAQEVNPLLERGELGRRFASPAQNERAWRRFTLNQWLEPVGDEAAIGAARWQELADPNVSVVPPVCFGVDVSPDRSTAAIVAASYDGDSAARRVCLDVIEAGMGVAWVIDRLRDLMARHENVGVVLDGAGPAGALVPRLEEFGVRPLVTTAREYARGCQALFDLVEEGRLAHRDQGPLNHAVVAAGRRRLVDGWAWSRTRSLEDVTSLVAGTLAAYGLETRGPVSLEAMHALG